MRRSTTWQWLGAGSGGVASVLLIAGMILKDVNDQVSVQASSGSIARTFLENRFEILAGSYLTLLGVFLLVLFLAFLRTYLAQVSDDHWLVSAAFGGGLIACAMLLLGTHFTQAFTVLPTYRGETQVAKALYILEWNHLLLVEAPPLAALVGALIVIGFMYDAFPWWINGPGALLALLLLSPGLPGSGVVLFFLWLIVVSVFLVWKTRSGLTERAA